MWKIEEEYNRSKRLLDEAEEFLGDYCKLMQKNTDELAEYIFSFYGIVEKSDSYHYIRQLEESAEEFNWELRQKQQELEKARYEERREFSRKLDV